MEITIKRHRRNLSYEDAATLDELWELSRRFDRSFYRECKDRWDERSFDEYIVAVEGRLPYCASPEELVCQRETWDEIMAVLDHCTEKQRVRFLLYALYDFSLEEIAGMCGCSKGAVEKSINAVKRIFQNFGKGVYDRHFKTAIR